MLFNRKLLFLVCFTLILGLITLYLLNSSISLEKLQLSSKTLFNKNNLSTEFLINKYPFSVEESMGVMPAPNFSNRVNIWGRFVNLEKDKLTLKVFNDNIIFKIPNDLFVLKSSPEPDKLKYIDPKELSVDQKIVITIEIDNSNSYSVKAVQIPFD